MRIIGGEFKRRLLNSPPDASTTRPITDRVKESLFNLLRGHTEDRTVIDCFAGTGSIGLEAISRGAERCIFIEKDRDIAALLRSNIAALGVEDRCELVRADALGPAALASCPAGAHLIFFDPPYALIEDPARLPHVLEALGRFVQLLDDDGYAALRTPWPLFAPREEGLPKRELSLEVPGALGPETHDYNNMAIHLYMRRKDE
ncbi:MAG: 16S rRNA (guanine(966)-N(2))-methyltransferase RsmD [Planctomycetota bacterium]|nr:16S rRNA (guanine(966)-N(2))-methyltransferase RsmD [Planctomycetota bacterium]